MGCQRPLVVVSPIKLANGLSNLGTIVRGVYSDRCISDGMEAHWEDHTVKGVWPKRESVHINALEMRAVGYLHSIDKHERYVRMKCVQQKSFINNNMYHTKGLGVSVLVSDFRGLGLEDEVLVSDPQVSVSVLVSDPQVSVSVSVSEGEVSTTSL